MEIGLFVHSCCCVLPQVFPFMTIGMLGGLRDSRTAKFKYKGKIQQTQLHRNYSDATTVPQQMHSLHGQPVPAGYPCPHKVPCCNNSVTLSLFFSVQDITYCLTSSSHWNKGNHLQPFRPSPMPPPESPAQPPCFSFCKFPALTAHPCKADAPAMGRMTRAHPAPSVPPLSHCTCLITSWQFFGQISLVSWKGSSSKSNPWINKLLIPQHGCIPSAQAPACTMLCRGDAETSCPHQHRSWPRWAERRKVFSLARATNLGNGLRQSIAGFVTEPHFLLGWEACTNSLQLWQDRSIGHHLDFKLRLQGGVEL